MICGCHRLVPLFVCVYPFACVATAGQPAVSVVSDASLDESIAREEYVVENVFTERVEENPINTKVSLVSEIRKQALSAKKEEQQHQAALKSLRAQYANVSADLKRQRLKEASERDEADGHFRYAKKLDGEDQALKASQAAAARVAKKTTMRNHAAIEKHAKDTAKGSAYKNVAALHGPLFQQLRQRVQVVAAEESTKAASDMAKKEVQKASKTFEVSLHARMVDSARKEAKKAASAGAKAQAAAHHDNFDKVSGALVEQATKEDSSSQTRLSP